MRRLIDALDRTIEAARDAAAARDELSRAHRTRSTKDDS
jgi:hypothetical protein